MFIALLDIGTAAGFIATRLMGLQTDLPTTIGIGILGALGGGFLLRILFAVTGLAATIVSAVLGTMALIWLWKLYGPGRR